MSGRERLIMDFLARTGWARARRLAIPGDASFRRYERLDLDGRRAILMDAPPPMEDVRPFLKVAACLEGLGLSAPRVYGTDEARGLVLLEDLGDLTFTRALAANLPEAELYRLAVDTLIALQERTFALDPQALAFLPPYDDAELQREANLLVEWFLPARRDLAVPGQADQSYLEAWGQVWQTARKASDTLVLRDYHVDNLMLVDDRMGVMSCGLLDFQDALIGPASYDLVSLLEDARRDVPPAVAEAALERYFDAFPTSDRAGFMASYAVLGAQRHAKVIGIFTRLCWRDGKAQYLSHLPRVWRLLERNLAHPALAPVKAWFDREIPPADRAAPPVGRVENEAT